ncbi:putative methyltransferase-domain-containing protein [Circinella umbellata]|nr:putative methyltransferase-domain-containing protein [Circinella umbellata]
MTSLFYARYLKPPPSTANLGKSFTIAWTIANDLGEISYWEPLTVYCRLITTNNPSLGLLLDKSNNKKKHSKNNDSNNATITLEEIRRATTVVTLEYDPVKGGGIMTNSLAIVNTTNNSGSIRNNTNTNGVTVQLVLELSDRLPGHPIWTNARSLIMYDDVYSWVIPVYSLPIQISLSPSTLSTASQYSNNNNDNNIHDYERRVTIHRFGASSANQQQDLFIHEDASPSIGSHIWDCGMLMCQYLADKYGMPRFDRILELGSGTAIAGIYAAHILQPSIIYLTDLEDTVPTIQHSVSLLEGDPLIKDVKIIVKELEWGKPLILSDQQKKKKRKTEQFDGFVDMVLLTDVLYNPSFHDALIDTLQQLMNINPKMKILLGYKPRGEEEERTFFDKIKTNLGWEWEMTLFPPAEIYWITSST